MRYVDEYRNRDLCRGLVREIESRIHGKITLMEVCGTHTVSTCRFGLRQMLPGNLILLSGPGCPVCVTAQEDLDKAINVAARERTIVVTYGDMMRVPGSRSSLAEIKAEGGDVRVVHSTLEALEIARNNPAKDVVFLAVGFETTAPASAVAVLEASKRKIDNFFILCAHKLIPPAMKALVKSGEVMIDGFLCPGHVSTVIGSKPYEFIARDFGIPCVIAGFEPVDILEAIVMLVRQIEKGTAHVEIQYRRSVRPEGNSLAMRTLFEVFEVSDSKWRGIGAIPSSGLRLREAFRQHDAEEVLEVESIESSEPNGCICGEILRGVKFPKDCQLFGVICTPENPVGPCMVSSEGTCGAHYRYAHDSIVSNSF